VSKAARKGVKITRDGILFFAGLLGAVHETLFANADRPALLVLFGGMMGLPAFLRADESKK
jgi:hypothetical protein